MTNTELSKVKAKIMALSRKTLEAGCSESESMSAMAVMGKLLEQYNLTMNECDVRESKCVTVDIPVPSLRRTEMHLCVMALAELFHGRAWFSKGYRGYRSIDTARYCFFVQEQDKEALEYLFSILWFAIENGVKNYKRSAEFKALRTKKHFARSFKKGMASRLDVRLRQMRKDADMRYAAEKGTGTSLIVLKGQLVNAEFAKMNMKLVKSYYRGKGVRNYEAYFDGDKQGEKVNLNRPLTDGNKVAGYITA